ncbi:MAG: hypothetical protein ACJAWL_000838 [Motiliproteus sp.]|jgi:hypothetical protein
MCLKALLKQASFFELNDNFIFKFGTAMSMEKAESHLWAIKKPLTPRWP